MWYEVTVIVNNSTATVAGMVGGVKVLVVEVLVVVVLLGRVRVLVLVS